MPLQLHPSITLERLEDAARRQLFDMDDPGFCVACGDETDGVEPDAQKGRCQQCGAMAVYGAEQLLLEMIG